MRVPTDFEQKLMSEARAKRDAMVTDRMPCCINCGWAALRPAFVHKDPDWFSAHYICCTWPRLVDVASSVPKPREAAKDPIMVHVAGTECAVFKLREDLV